MERQAVSSSNIASIGYNPDTETLEVEFNKTGKVYEYYNVPQFMYDRLMEAPSTGVFFSAEIRSAYACTLFEDCAVDIYYPKKMAALQSSSDKTKIGVLWSGKMF